MQLEMLKTLKLPIYGLCGAVLAMCLVACGSQQTVVKPMELESVETSGVEAVAAAVAVPGEETNQTVLVDPSPERLVQAARYGQERSLNYLLDGGMDVNGRDAYGNTALNAAASNGQAQMVELLLERGADVNIANKKELTALMGAATRGDYELVYRLVEKGAKVNAINTDGETALFLAVKYGHYKAAKVLLKGGANPNLRNTLPANASNGGYTPLMYAATHGLNKTPTGWAEMAQLLLDNGANPNLTSSHGDAALHFAQVINDQGVVEVLKRGGAKDDKVYAGLNLDETLLKASKLGDDIMMKQVLATGANPNFADKNGVTPLLAAAYEGQLAALKLLLEANAEVNFVPSGLRQFALSKSHAPLNERELMEAASRGDTGLTAAVRQGHLDEVAFLLEHDARIDLSNRHGEAPLFVAVTAGNLAMVKLLLDRGGDANALEQDNRRNRLALAKHSMGKDSLLIAAVDKGHQEIARLLIENGADVNYRGFMGKTALFMAVEDGHLKLVSYLLEQKADPNIGSLAGITPIMEAARMGNHRVVAALIAGKANVNVIESPELGYARETQGGGSTGMTALMFAVRGGHERVVEQLLQAGAETKIHNADGENALSIATDSGYDDIVNLLTSSVETNSVVLSVVK